MRIHNVENFVSCDNTSLWSCEWSKHNLEQTAETISRQSYAFLGVLKISLASELTIARKRKFACNPALVGQNVHVHSGHIHVSFAFF